MKMGMLVTTITSLIISAHATDNQVRVERAVGDQSVAKEAWGPEGGWSESELSLFSADPTTISTVQHSLQSSVNSDWYKQVALMPFSYGEDSTSYTQGVLKRYNQNDEDHFCYVVSHPLLEGLFMNFPAGEKEYTFDNGKLISIISNGVVIVQYTYSNIEGEEDRLLSGTYLDMFDKEVPFTFEYRDNNVVSLKRRSATYNASSSDYSLTLYNYNSDNQVLSSITTDHNSYGVDTLNRIEYQYDSTWSGVTKTKVTYVEHWNEASTEFVSDSVVNSYDENGYEVYWRRVQRRDPQTIVFDARGTKAYFSDGTIKKDIYEVTTDSTDWEVYYSRTVTRTESNVSSVDTYNYFYSQPNPEKRHSTNEWDYYANGWPSVCRTYSRSENELEYTLSSTDSIHYGNDPVELHTEISPSIRSLEVSQLGDEIEWSLPDVSNEALKLYSAQGREVGEVQPSATGTYSYSTVFLAPGVYLFSIQTLSGVHSGRFIVQ